MGFECCIYHSLFWKMQKLHENVRLHPGTIVYFKACICVLVAPYMLVIFPDVVSSRRLVFSLNFCQRQSQNSAHTVTGPDVAYNPDPQPHPMAGLAQPPQRDSLRYPSPPLSQELERLWLQQQTRFSSYGMADSMEDTFYEKRTPLCGGHRTLQLPFTEHCVTSEMPE